MKKTKRNYLVAVLVIILASLAIGYAAFSETLTISGTANAKGTFDMIFASASIDTANAQGIDKVNSKAEVDPSDSNVVNVVIKDLAYPGAGAAVTVVIKNNGTVDAVLKKLTLSEVDPDIEVFYPDAATGFKEGEVVPAQGTCTVTFYVKWKTTSTYTAEKTVDFSATLDYEQYTPEFNGSTSHTNS